MLHAFIAPVAPKIAAKEQREQDAKYVSEKIMMCHKLYPLYPPLITYLYFMLTKSCKIDLEHIKKLGKVGG